MKVAYVDLQFTFFAEDYSISPSRYGGGRVFASWCKEFFDFSIFASEESFNNVGVRQPEAKEKCILLSEEQRKKIISGTPLKAVSSDFDDFDIILHPHTNTVLNLECLKAKQVVWSPGREETINPAHKHLLLYNDFQKPRLENPETKISKFILGIKLPDFESHPKEDFLFQCSRHVDAFCSIDVAQFCLEHKIPGIFAGPIAEGYPLLNFIDNKTTFYLGQISEKVKQEYLSRARLCTLIQNWETPFSLSAVESLAFGTPVVCTGMGFWPSLIKNGVNGFFATNEVMLKEAWDKSDSLNQKDCYQSILKHNHFAMTTSVMDCLTRILDEN